jgi:hypothetical protein
MSEFPSVTTVLKVMGFYDGMDLAPAANSVVGKERGSALHRACHWLALGQEPPWKEPHPELDRFLDGYRRFQRDHHWDMRGFEDEWVNNDERIVAHPDQFGKLGPSNAETVIEIKTGGEPDSVGLQTAGQAIAGRKAGLRRMALILPGDGNYKLRALTDYNDFKEFRALLTAVHVRAKYQGRFWELA